MPVGGTRRDAKNLGRLCASQAGEVAQLHESGLERLPGSQLLQCLIEVEQFLVGRAGSHVVEFLALKAAAAFCRPFAARVLDQDTAHGGGGRGKEVTTAFPMLLL